MRSPASLGAAFACALLLSACAHTPADDPADPLEPVNRGIYAFNETADRYVLRPVAKGYEAAVPDVARQGVHNFLSNLFYPTVVVNDVLQAKFLQGTQDLCRFVINTTVGIGGLFDVATRGGFAENDEDFGQTLGYWGLGQGWYLMLPLLGPSDNRDLVGRAFDYTSNPMVYVNDPYAGYGVAGLDAVDTRVGLLRADKFLEQQLDRYVFVRTIYLQSRNAKVYDGNPPREEIDFGDGDDKPAEDSTTAQPAPSQ